MIVKGKTVQQEETTNAEHLDENSSTGNHGFDTTDAPPWNLHVHRGESLIASTWIDIDINRKNAVVNWNHEQVIDGWIRMK